MTSAWRRSTSWIRKTRLRAKDFPGKTPAVAVVARKAAAAELCGSPPTSPLSLERELRAQYPLAYLMWNLIDHIHHLATGADGLGKLYYRRIALGPAAKGAAAMTRSARTATLVVLLCLPVLALSDLAAWAKHHRMGPHFPCPDRCKSTRLSICSACMGGIKTCAQQHVCSNNRSVVCGDESTVSVPCWNQRYRW